ncbi:Glucosidase 2 subunit beta [Candida viswanathii]|uniref:Glucosidase 2 subunit beta n=1 Tax=Candida viswanathii TaxID=5486 RepID=A0A367Y9L4_9ASCO|nr:Glucosidase 2 subunit beta [Candida viswanathii]
MLQKLLVIASVASIALGDIRGVSPEKQHLYQPITENGKQYWHCLNDSSIKLTYDQINDDFCDCPDGSDEPGTHACPNPPFKFYCANRGHFPNYIPHFKVNDGVCDYDVCCDGSDELGGICEDKCKEIHRQFEDYKAKVEKSVSAALSKKQGIIADAKNKRDRLVNNLKKLEQMLPHKKMQLNQLQLQWEEKGDQDLSVYDVLGEHISDLVSRLDAHKKDITKQEHQIQLLEKLLDTLSHEYNPNFNDPAVKDSIHKYQEYISNKDEEIKEDIKETNKILHELAERAKTMNHNGGDYIQFKPTLGNMLHHYFQLFTGTFLTKPELQVKSTLSSDELSTQIESLENEIASIEHKITAIKENLNSDFGPDDVLRAYELKTITKRLGGYNYLIHILGSVLQDDVLIGNFKKYEDGKVYFDKGSKCWNGPHRSAVVEFECGDKLELVSVSEPEKCRYSFLVRGEAWCQPVTDEDILATFKIDYDLL